MVAQLTLHEYSGLLCILGGNDPDHVQEASLCAPEQ